MFGKSGASESFTNSMRGDGVGDGPPAGENAEQVNSIRMADPVGGINSVFEESPMQDDTGQFAPAESPAVEGEIVQIPLMPENTGSQVLDAAGVEPQTHGEHYMKALIPKAEGKIDWSTGSSTFTNINNYGDPTGRMYIDHNEDSKGIRSLEESRHLEAINQGNASVAISTHKETNQLFSSKTAKRMQQPPPLNQPVGQPNGLMTTLEVTIHGIASTWSPEQLQSYSPAIALQLALPQQIEINLGDNLPRFYLTFDKKGYYNMSTPDINHPMITELKYHLNQKSPGTQHPLVASLINSLPDSSPSSEPSHSGPPGC